MARTGMSRARSSSVTRRPVLPCCPPAAPVTNTVIALSHRLWYRSVPHRRYGTVGYHVKGRAMTEETPVRRRILDAAFSTFIEAGYAATTMLEIARRAHVSKRELYAVVGNKQEMLATCIRERSQRLRPPADLPAPHDRASLEGALIAVGSRLLGETTQDTVIAAFRLAIAEA